MMEKSNFKHRRLDENHVLLTEKKGKEVTAILVHRDASPLESGLKDIDDDLVDSDLPSYTYSEYKGKKFGQKKLLHMLRQAEPKELDSVDGALSFYRSADAKNHFEYIELNVARCMDAINKAELFETLGMKDDLLMSIESAACFALNAAKENNPRYSYVREGLKLDTEIRLQCYLDFFAGPLFHDPEEVESKLCGLDEILDFLNRHSPSPELHDNLYDTLHSYSGDMAHLEKIMSKKFPGSSEDIDDPFKVMDVGLEYLIGDRLTSSLLLPNLDEDKKKLLLSGFMKYFTGKEQKIASALEKDLNKPANEIYKQIQDFAAAKMSSEDNEEYSLSVIASLKEMLPESVEVSKESFSDALDTVLSRHKDEPVKLATAGIHIFGEELAEAIGDLHQIDDCIDLFGKACGKFIPIYDKTIGPAGSDDGNLGLFLQAVPHFIYGYFRDMSIRLTMENTGIREGTSLDRNQKAARGILDNCEHPYTPHSILARLIARNPLNALLYAPFRTPKMVDASINYGRLNPPSIIEAMDPDNEYNKMIDPIETAITDVKKMIDGFDNLVDNLATSAKNNTCDISRLILLSLSGQSESLSDKIAEMEKNEEHGLSFVNRYLEQAKKEISRQNEGKSLAELAKEIDTGIMKRHAVAPIEECAPASIENNNPFYTRSDKDAFELTRAHSISFKGLLRWSESFSLATSDLGRYADALFRYLNGLDIIDIDEDQVKFDFDRSVSDEGMKGLADRLDDLSDCYWLAKHSIKKAETAFNLSKGLYEEIELMANNGILFQFKAVDERDIGIVVPRYVEVMVEEEKTRKIPYGALFNIPLFVPAIVESDQEE